MRRFGPLRCCRSRSPISTAPARCSRRQGKERKDRHAILSPTLLAILREWWHIGSGFFPGRTRQSADHAAAKARLPCDGPAGGAFARLQRAEQRLWQPPCGASSAERKNAAERRHTYACPGRRRLTGCPSNSLLRSETRTKARHIGRAELANQRRFDLAGMFHVQWRRKKIHRLLRPGRHATALAEQS